MPRRQRSIQERIGPDTAWLSAQFLLLSVAALAGPLGRVLLGRAGLPWPRALDITVGLIAMCAGGIVAAQARDDLGDSLRVSPTPLDDAALVDRGWYGRVRHPLYLAVMLALCGWSLVWSNLAALGVTLAGLGFFSVKARHEERLLMSRYADYEQYMRRVRSRFVPRIW